MNELLPCPFCGSSDIDPEGVASFKREYRGSDATWDTAKPEQIENRPACQNCNASTDSDWNTRSTPAPQSGAWVETCIAEMQKNKHSFVEFSHPELENVLAATNEAIDRDAAILRRHANPSKDESHE